MIAPSHAILLIDDDQEKLQGLAARVRDRDLKWLKCENGIRARTRIRRLRSSEKVGEDTVLVVTDYDLTTAVKGLFGHSVVAWCRNQFIPVGDFSRGHRDALSTEPDLFELRVPRVEADAVDYIVRIFDGFRRIRAGIEAHPEVAECGAKSSAGARHAARSREDLESQLGPYLSRPGLFNSFLLDTLRGGTQGKGDETAAEKVRLLTYILGHVLVNAVLKYPGPILAGGPLCAYLAASPKDSEKVAGLFRRARYTGPFDGGETLYWGDEVDVVIEEMASEFEVEDAEYKSFGEYRRAVVGKALGGSLAKHDCDRCDGEKGGFWCPFTRRAVCERGDCSSTSSSWVPFGAYACRVERGLLRRVVPDPRALRARVLRNGGQSPEH